MVTMPSERCSWDGADQPPEEKTQPTCFYTWKYKYLQEGLNILLIKLKQLHKEAQESGILKELFSEEIGRTERLIEWGDNKLRNNSGLVEESGVSTNTLRYLKAGILLRIQDEEKKKNRNLSPRIVQALDEEIYKLKLLSEERWFEKLKPIDAYFEIGLNYTNAHSINGRETSFHKPVRLFYCYSHDDMKLRNKLELHLGLLKREGLLAGWHDREILPGKEWEGQIDRNLNIAQIVLLLVSASFISSDYCYKVEMKRALERHKAGECRVVPIILRHCDWQGSQFGHLEALPSKGQVVMGGKWKNADEAFTNVAKGIRKLVSNIML